MALLSADVLLGLIKGSYHYNYILARPSSAQEENE
jgi:hypothetical protein